MGRKLMFCYVTAFCKIGFYHHVPELFNKKVHSRPYHIHSELGHIFIPTLYTEINFSKNPSLVVFRSVQKHFVIIIFLYKKINLATSWS